MALIEKSGLVPGRIERRYQRFLADVRLEDGGLVTAHCTNTGTMKTCWEPGDLVLLEPASNPDRKLKFTWIACRRGEAWIGVDTGMPNKLVAEAARRDVLPGLEGLHGVRTEVRYGEERSRIDVLALDAQERQIYLEVKNATLRIQDTCCFPDAVTERGLKHLRELQAMVAAGHRAAIVFFIHRSDVHAFDAARDIDPAYGKELDQASRAGVLVLPVLGCIHAEPSGDGTWRAAWELPGLLPWSQG